MKTLRYPILSLIAYLLLSTNLVLGQDVKADLLRLHNAYADKQINASMKLLIYPSYSAKKAVDQFDARYLYDGKQYYYAMGEHEMVQNGTFSLLVDHAHKAIMIQPSVQPPIPSLTETIDSLIQRASNVTHDLQGVRSRYSFEYRDGPYPRIDLVFDRKTWLVERVIHYYRKGSYQGASGITEEDAVRSELVYEKTSFELGANSTAFFKETRFIILKNGRYQVLANYRNYRLFDFINID